LVGDIEGEGRSYQRGVARRVETHVHGGGYVTVTDIKREAVLKGGICRRVVNRCESRGTKLAPQRRNPSIAG
jgi:hypothetical protein